LHLVRSDDGRWLEIDPPRTRGNFPKPRCMQRGARCVRGREFLPAWASRFCWTSETRSNQPARLCRWVGLTCSRSQVAASYPFLPVEPTELAEW